MITRLLVALAVLSSACSGSGLGPVPGVTAASVTPRSSPGIEVQRGIVPGYDLRDATTNPETRGDAFAQTSAFVEPGKLIGLEDVALGARYVSGGTFRGHFEPMLRYRHGFADSFAVGVVGFGTHASHSLDDASYSMTRGGVEIGFDLLASPRNHVLELHLQAGGSATVLSADVHYCQNAFFYPAPCDGAPPNTSVHFAGAHPVVFGGFSLDVANRLGHFHGLRAQLLIATGTMPSASFGTQKSESWTSFGLMLSLGLGASDEPIR